MKAKVIAAVCAVSIWGCNAALEAPESNLPGVMETGTATAAVDDIPSPVLKAMNDTASTADARESDRKKAYDGQKTQLEPMDSALYDAVKAAKGVDMTGYLSASQTFANNGSDKLDPKWVAGVNAQYGPPIKSAVATATGITGVGGIMQQVQTINPIPPGAPQGAGGAGGCCSTVTFQPPWSGLYEEGDFGSRAIRPGPTTDLAATVRSAIAAAPHRLEQSGRLVTVSPTAFRVSAAANLDTSWVIGLSGLGYAHVWLGMDMWVTKPDGTVVCRASHLEQDNQWTWAGGILTASDHRPGPHVVRGCSFDRAPGDPTEYSVNVSITSDGTFIGFSGGYGDYFVHLGTVDVTSCG